MVQGGCFLGGPETRKLVTEQMQRLQTEYLDLYLWHKAFLASPHTSAAAKDSWRELEKMHAEGLIRSLGVSNHSAKQLKSVISFAYVKPEVNQIKFDVFRPGYQHPKEGVQDLVRACRENRVHVVGYSTLSGWPLVLAPVTDPHVLCTAAKYNCTAAQLLLRHSLQKGIAVIPASGNLERLESNLQVQVRSGRSLGVLLSLVVCACA